MEGFLNVIQTLIYECDAYSSLNYSKFINKKNIDILILPSTITLTFSKIRDNQWELQPVKVLSQKNSLKKTNYTNADLIEIIGNAQNIREQSAILIKYDKDPIAYWLKDALVKYIEDTAIRVDSLTDVVSSTI